MDQGWDYCPVCDHVVSLFEACLKCEKVQCGGCNAVCCLAETASTSGSSTPRASEKRQALPKREPKERPTVPVSFRSDLFEFRQSILAMPEGSSSSHLFACKETFDAAFQYISDMYKPLSHLSPNYGCSQNEINRSNAAKRLKRSTQDSEPCRNKTSKLITPGDPGKCIAQMRLNPGQLQIRIIIAHSCHKQFPKVPEALNLYISSSLSASLSAGRDLSTSRREAVSNVVSSSFNLLVPLRCKLSKHVHNLSNHNQWKRLEGNSVGLGKVYLLDKSEIAKADVLTVTDPSSSKFGRRVLAFYYRESEKILEAITSAGLSLIFSLDLTHCVTKDSKMLMTLMIRSPDSLRFISLMQAYTEGEDAGSISQALEWLDRELRITSRLVPKIFLIDDSDAERKAITQVFGSGTPIFLCLFHVISNISKNLDVNCLSITQIERIRATFAAEDLQKFKLIAESAVKSALTIKESRFQHHTSVVSQTLSECTAWWSSKADLTEVSRWWNGYLLRSHQWALSHRAAIEDTNIRLCATQSLSTAQNESFHSILKGNGQGKVLKNAELIQSIQLNLNAVRSVFQLHYRKLVECYFSPVPSSPFSLKYAAILTSYPRNLHSDIFAEYHEVSKLVLLAEKKHDLPLLPEKEKLKVRSADEQLTKWFAKFNDPASISSHRCRRSIGFGIPCRHIFSALVKRSDIHKHLQSHWREDPTSCLRIMLSKISDLVRTSATILDSSLLELRDIPQIEPLESAYIRTAALPSEPEQPVLRATTLAGRPLIVQISSTVLQSLSTCSFDPSTQAPSG